MPRYRDRPARQQREDRDHRGGDDQDGGQLSQRRTDHFAEQAGGVAQSLHGRQRHPDRKDQEQHDHAEPCAQQIAHHPARPAHGTGEDGFGPAADLLLAHPQQYLDRVDGGHDAGELDHRRDEGVEHLVRAGHALVPIPEAALLGRRALGDGAEDQTESKRADQPGEEGRALQTPGQPERPKKAASGPGRAALYREQTAAEIAP